MSTAGQIVPTAVEMHERYRQTDLGLPLPGNSLPGYPTG